MIIISASGMATGGRVLHHMRVFAPDPNHAIVFTGFQAVGTRGASMIADPEIFRSGQRWKSFTIYRPRRIRER